MWKSRIFAPLLAVAALGAAAAPAQAGLLLETAPACADESPDRVFKPWLDPAQYVLVPGGQAEGPQGWSSLNGATFVAGNEPWTVVDDTDGKSLRLSGSATATTDTFCVGIDHPTARFFARSTGTGLLSTLKVDMLVEDQLGLLSSLPVGVVLPTGGSWTPTLPYLLVPSILPLLPGDMTPVRLRFSVLGAGAWQIDDIHVDPYKRT